MRKILFLSVFLLILNLIACGDVTLGGNPNEWPSCQNHDVMKVHGQSLKLDINMNCLYEKKCDVNLIFKGGTLVDSLKGKCFGGGAEWRFESFDTSMVVNTDNWKRHQVKLSQDDHLRFSLFDIQNIEKKYDLDLSGIVRSYTVRGDSVDVNVMKECMIYVYTRPRNTKVYGSRILNSLYTFAKSDSEDDWMSYDCLLHNQGPWEVDDLDVHAKIYWK